MSVIRKDWGETRCIFRNETVEVWHASVKAGGKSSVHRHNRKLNLFYLVSGEMVLHSEQWAAGYSSFQARDEAYSLPAGTWHQFEAKTDVELIEVYHLEPIDEEDIERADEQEAKELRHNWWMAMTD